MHYPKPVINYIGGKVRLRRQIVPHFPRDAKRYVEPMVGGGSVFASAYFNLYWGKPAWISDLDADVIDLYMVVKNDVEWLIGMLTELYEELGAEGAYKEVVGWNPPGSLPLHNAVKVYILARTTFAGKRTGNFISSKAASYVWTDFSNLRLMSLMLNTADARMWRMSVLNALRTCNEDDFVYLDPPYIGKEHFYKEGADFDHAALADALAKARFRFILSYGDDPKVAELYPPQRFYRIKLSHRYTVTHQDGRGDAPASEYLISNMPFAPQPIQEHLSRL